jgi:YVTN family beta-propeller protein
MAITSNGSKLYVAAIGSDKVGIFNTAQLEANTFVPNTNNQIEVSGGGPTGLALNEQKNRLYVLTRFDNSISVVNTTTKTEIGHIPMHNPEQESVVAGRRFLYDARFTSSHGDSSCATCHIFGDFDSLAWDLGNPDGAMLNHPGPFIGPLFNFITQQPIDPDFQRTTDRCTGAATAPVATTRRPRSPIAALSTKTPPSRSSRSAS